MGLCLQEEIKKLKKDTNTFIFNKRDYLTNFGL
jgi:phage host-nuclease inhibitor protein Gam